MKKAVSVIAAILLIFVFGTAVYAADYYIDDFDMHISIPPYYDVFISGMDKETYDNYGYEESYEETMAFLEENSYNFFANSWDGYGYISAFVFENYGINYSSCTEGKLNDEMAGWHRSLTSNGTYECHEKEIISVGNNKFIKFVLSDVYNQKEVLYITSHGRDLVMIEYVCSEEAFDDEFAAMAKESMESIVFGNPAEAAEQPAAEYYVAELGAYVTVPDKYYVMTSDYCDERLGEVVSEDEISEFIETNAAEDRCLSVIEKDFSYNFSLIVDIDTDGFTDENEYFAIVKETYAGMDIEIIKDEIIEIGGINYLRLKYKSTSDTSKGFVYFALKDGKLIAYNVVISYGELTERIENELYSMIESTRYSGEEPVFEEIESFVITDELLGFSMTVPKNWFTDESKNEFYGDIHNYVIYSAKNASDFITCTAMSIKAFASDMTFGFVELTEEDFGSETIKDYADILEVPEEAVTETELGGKTYYVAEKEESGYLGTGAVTIKNGVYYFYYFSDTAESESYPIFEEFLANVEYTEPVISSENAPQTETEKLMDTVGTVLIVFIVIGILVIVGVVVIIIVAVNKSRKKKQRYVQGAEEQPGISEQISSDREKRFCTACGAEIREDGVFCTKCGTPVNKD